VTVERLQALVERLEAENAQLKGKIIELEARLRQNSSNSSKPPSSDPPGAVPRGKKRTGKRRGGQPGHPKHERELVPPEKVRKTEVVKPEYCRVCSHELDGEDPAPYRHQVFELPKIEPTVDEWQLHCLVCPRCRARTRAQLPDGVPTGQFGPRIQAMVSVASGAYRLSKRNVEEMFSDFFGVELSLGTICNLQQDTSHALAQPFAEALAHIQQERGSVSADETSWFEAKKKAWLWIAISMTVAVFLIRPSRGAKVAMELLGETFAGYLNSDRWVGYDWVDIAHRQICWSHLDRHWESFVDLGGEAKRFGRALQKQTDQMFHLWHRVRDGTLKRSSFRRYMRPIQRKVGLLLRRGEACSIPKVAGRCKRILKLEVAMWTFVRVESIEPTNNRGERGVRHPVMWRKVSFGTDSENGSRFVERVLTAVVTLRLQHRNVLNYFTAACEAVLHGRPVPSLLPECAPFAAQPALAIAA
jgi:transposase